MSKLVEVIKYKRQRKNKYYLKSAPPQKKKPLKEKKISFLRKMQLRRAVNPDKSNYFTLWRNTR